MPLDYPKIEETAMPLDYPKIEETAMPLDYPKISSIVRYISVLLRSAYNHWQVFPIFLSVFLRTISAILTVV